MTRFLLVQRARYDRASEGVYTVELEPDPRFGLGLRLEEKEGSIEKRIIVAMSFKRAPGNDQKLAAEQSGSIVLGDQLLRVNDRDITKSMSLREVVLFIRDVSTQSLSTRKKETVKMTFQALKNGIEDCSDSKTQIQSISSV